MKGLGKWRLALCFPPGVLLFILLRACGFYELPFVSLVQLVTSLSLLEAVIG